MIDTHCHVLPGIDDGACTVEEALEMCRLAIDDGIATIVATPHSLDGLYTNNIDDVRHGCLQMNRWLADYGIPLTILPGIELRTTPELVKLVTSHNVPTINAQRYFLLEFHPAQLPQGFELFARLALDQGYGIVLAHPEKNIAIQQDLQKFYWILTLFEPGDILVQITADSVKGRNGSSARKTSLMLLEHNMAHLIASDGHDTLERKPVISEAIEEVGRIVGSDRAMTMVNAVPHAVVTGGTLPELERPTKPRRFWQVFWHRRT